MIEQLSGMPADTIGFKAQRQTARRPTTRRSSRRSTPRLPATVGRTSSPNSNDFHGWTRRPSGTTSSFDDPLREIKKIAIVGERAWEKYMAAVCKPFTMPRSNTSTPRTGCRQGVASTSVVRRIEPYGLRRPLVLLDCVRFAKL